MRLGPASRGRDNNLNLLRLLAAGAVVVSHAWPIALGAEAHETFTGSAMRCVGWAAVTVFFALSGYLITGSWARRPEVAPYVAARALRLFPALAVMLILSVVLVGPLLTTQTVGAYFADPALFDYVWRNLTLVSPRYPLPGAMDGLPYAQALNGSLWTLFHEAACYAVILFLGIAGGLATAMRLKAALAFYAAAYLISAHPDVLSMVPARIEALRGLSLPFALGVAGWAWRDRIVLNWSVGLALAAVVGVMAVGPLAAAVPEVAVLTLAYWAALLGYRPAGAIRGWNRAGDYSYGVYIWGFPVQQLVIRWGGPMEAWENALLSLPLVFIPAVLSWHLIESPALRAKDRLARTLSGRVRAQAATPRP